MAELRRDGAGGSARPTANARCHVVLDVRCVVPGALDGVGRHWWLTLAALPDVLARARDVPPGAVDPALRVTLVARASCVDAIRAQTRGAFDVVGTDIPVASLSQHITWPRFIATLPAGAPDVVTYPQYDMPWVPAGAGSVATVYDFTPLDEPHYFGAGRGHRRLAAAALLASTVARADRVTTLCETIADDIARRFPSARPRLRVLPPGPVSLPPPSPFPALSRARFAYVGNHRPHKRVPFLLDVFARFRSTHPELAGDAELVLAGRSDPRFAEVVERARATPGVTVLEGPSDAAVAELVASCRALLFASVGEGYGFPVVEAQSLGTPAIVAGAGSLPEVVGDAGLVVTPPDDVDAWVRALTRLLDDATRADLSQKAKAAVAARSWERCAEKLVAIWREIWRERAVERKNGHKGMATGDVRR